MSMKLCTAMAGLLALGLLAAPPVLGQDADDDIRREIEVLKQGQREIRNQLNEIKRLLQQQRKPAKRPGPQVKDVVFNLRGNDVRGERDASLTLIEFTDYQ